MKFEITKKIIPAIFIAVVTMFSVSCTNSGANSPSGSPTESYKSLHSAVKGKNVDSIKKAMSKQSLGFAESVAQRQNVPLDKVLENGFTATTLGPEFPEMRDERVKDGFGALEVYNSNDKRWEDLPFVLEDGTWKLAVGDLFANTYKLPSKGRAVLEMEAANASGKNPMTVVNTNSMGNFKSGARPPQSNAMSNANAETNSAKK